MEYYCECCDLETYGLRRKRSRCVRCGGHLTTKIKDLRDYRRMEKSKNDRTVATY